MEQVLKFQQISTNNSSKTWLIGGCPHIVENTKISTKHDDFQTFKSKNQRNSCVHELACSNHRESLKSVTNSTYNFSQEYGHKSYMENIRGLQTLKETRIGVRRTQEQ